MNLFERAKNILFAPAKEWAVIQNEQHNHIKTLTNYLLVLALIPMVAEIVGYGLIGSHLLGIWSAYGLKLGAQKLISIIGSAYFSAWVFDLVGTNYGVEKNFDRKFALVAYSYTAMCVGGIFYLIPGFGRLVSLTSLYSFYLLWTGFIPMTGVEQSKKTIYFVISLITMVIGWLAISIFTGLAFRVGEMF